MHSIINLGFLASSVVCDSQQMDGSLQLDVTGRFKYMTLKLSKRHGKDTAVVLCIVSDAHILFTTSVLMHESANNQGDLYVRSVCFSPDGKYLATGAEDKQIRVCFICIPSLLHHPYVSLDLGNRQKAHPQDL